MNVTAMFPDDLYVAYMLQFTFMTKLTCKGCLLLRDVQVATFRQLIGPAGDLYDPLITSKAL